MRLLLFVLTVPACLLIAGVVVALGQPVELMRHKPILVGVSQSAVRDLARNAWGGRAAEARPPAEEVERLRALGRMSRDLLVTKVRLEGDSGSAETLVAARFACGQASLRVRLNRGADDGWRVRAVRLERIASQEAPACPTATRLAKL